MIRVIAAFFLLVGLEAIEPAISEPPPRSERAPFTLGSRDKPPAFWESGWRPGYEIPPSWRPRYFYYETRYQTVNTVLGPVIETYADGTASWISRRFDHTFDPDEQTCINWAWSADRLPDLKASETTMSGDDFAIRLYVFGQAKSGEAYGFNYVWSTQQDPGSIWTSPFSDNRLMALRRGPNTTGDMVSESRDLAADLEAATGIVPSTIHAIAIMTDSEGSDSVAAARITEVVIGPCVVAVS